jgi:glycosyltransferase involved in cell wall biosynthesis
MHDAAVSVDRNIAQSSEPHFLRVLLVHNRYQLSGGEDEVYEREKELLTSQGHEVIEYVRHNSEILEYGVRRRVSFGLRTTWAWDSYSDLTRIIRGSKPDVAHFHNWFPLISPAAYYACSSRNVPVVQTLHNPRLLCPAATCYRSGAECQDCFGRIVPWPAVVHGCYRGSRAQSAAVGFALSVHNLLRTWRACVDRYIASTEFYREKFVEGKLPADKIIVKPHFVRQDPGPANGVRNFGLFVGRLSTEKGVACLLRAWQALPHIPLKIRGEGPLAGAVLEFVKTRRFVQVLPRLSRGQLYDYMKSSTFLVWPSEGLYETFGLVAIEAFACGLPVIASRAGVMQEVVSDVKTGLLFTPGDAEDLAAKINWAWAHPEEMRRMGRAARLEYETKYTAEKNYPMLMTIYESVMNDRKMYTEHPLT